MGKNIWRPSLQFWFSPTDTVLPLMDKMDEAKAGNENHTSWLRHQQGGGGEMLGKVVGL